ncbi:MAG: TolC family protein [bacterium]|nr:TolC family protein [bacterium]
MPRQIGHILFSALVLFSLSSCAGNKATVKNDIDMPESWQSATQSGAFDAATGWLDDLDDGHLKSLVAEAIESNHTLKAAKARAQAAGALSRIAGAPLLPAAEIGADASRRGSDTSTENSFSLSGTISWEADLWGRLGNGVRAAVYDEKAAFSDYNAARLALAAEVSLAWVAIIEARQQEALAVKTGESFRHALNIIEERYRLGLNAALDVRLARAEVASADSDIARRRRELDGLKRRIEVLMGRYPSAELNAAETLPRILRPVPAGLPSELLGRRPDLVAAELRLSAAGEELRQAGKNRLPSIRLTASGGYGSSDLDELLDGDNLLWNLMAGITQPIFQGGKLKAEEALARSGQAEALEEYSGAALIAFREVETALAAQVLYEEQLTFLDEACRESSIAVELALSQYAEGLTDVTTLLQSQQRAFNAKSTSLRTERERLDNRINLYLALGGDFLTTQD